MVSNLWAQPSLSQFKGLVTSLTLADDGHKVLKQLGSATVEEILACKM